MQERDKTYKGNKIKYNHNQHITINQYKLDTNSKPPQNQRKKLGQVDIGVYMLHIIKTSDFIT